MTKTVAYEVDEKMQQRVKSNLEKVSIPDDLSSRALDLEKHIKSEAYQDKLKEYGKRVKFAVGLDDLEPKQKATEEIDLSDRFILYISSNIPIETLRRYAKSVEKVNGLMVLRGTVGSDRKLQPTVRFIEEILKTDSLCEYQCEYLKVNVTIDPRLFQLNNIVQVPALTFIENMDMVNYIDKREGDGIPERSQTIVYGDASLHGMINELFRLTKNKKLPTYLDML